MIDTDQWPEKGRVCSKVILFRSYLLTQTSILRIRVKWTKLLQVLRDQTFILREQPMRAQARSSFVRSCLHFSLIMYRELTRMYSVGGCHNMAIL